jgi:hypothetical protein
MYSLHSDAVDVVLLLNGEGHALSLELLRARCT